MRTYFQEFPAVSRDVSYDMFLTTDRYLSGVRAIDISDENLKRTSSIRGIDNSLTVRMPQRSPVNLGVICYLECSLAIELSDTNISFAILDPNVSNAIFIRRETKIAIGRLPFKLS